MLPDSHSFIPYNYIVTHANILTRVFMFWILFIIGRKIENGGGNVRTCRKVGSTVV